MGMKQKILLQNLENREYFYLFMRQGLIYKEE